MKSFSFLRLLFVFLLSPSIICFSLVRCFSQIFSPWYISFPALTTSCLSSFIGFFIFLTLLFSFFFFSFLGGLLISNLISTDLDIAYIESIISDREFLSCRWFVIILLTLFYFFTQFYFHQSCSFALSSVSFLFVFITLSICAQNSFLSTSSSSLVFALEISAIFFHYIIIFPSRSLANAFYFLIVITSISSFIWRFYQLLCCSFSILNQNQFCNVVVLNHPVLFCRHCIVRCLNSGQHSSSALFTLSINPIPLFLACSSSCTIFQLY